MFAGCWSRQAPGEGRGFQKVSRFQAVYGSRDMTCMDQCLLVNYSGVTLLESWFLLYLV